MSRFSLLLKTVLRDAHGLVSLGDKYRDLRDWRLAAMAYRSALKIDPERASIWVQLGHACKESHQLPEAGEAYLKAIELRPDEADTHLQLGHYYKVCGETKLAGKAYLEALQIAPHLDSAYEELQQVGWSESHIIKHCPAVKTRRKQQKTAVISKQQDAGIFFTALFQSLSVGRRINARFGQN